MYDAAVQAYDGINVPVTPREMLVSALYHLDRGRSLEACQMAYAASVELAIDTDRQSATEGEYVAAQTRWRQHTEQRLGKVTMRRIARKIARRKKSC